MPSKVGKEDHPQSGLELRIWKGNAIYKKGTLDLGGHFGQAKGHHGHPRKGTKAKKKKKKGSKSNWGHV